MNSCYQVTDDYKPLLARYELFLENLDLPEADPIKLFNPLTKKQIDELELIREVSLDLQKKKEEDKAAQLAKQAAEEENGESVSEEKEEVTPKETEEKTE